MPYANPEEQKRARRESARRQRARVPQADVEPAAIEMQPTREMLFRAGAILHCARADGEPDDVFRERLRAAWEDLLSVVG